MITRNNIIVAFCSLLWLLFYEAPMSAQHMLEDVKSMFEKSKIYPDGTVYFTDDDGEKYAIPFATVSVYEKDDRDKLVYYVMADRFGHYRIPKYDYTKPFYYVLEAPGFVPKGELVDELPTVRKWDNDKPLMGNYSISFEVEKDSLFPDKPYSLRVFDAASLKKATEPGGLLELVGAVPGIKYEDGELSTTEGGAVRLKITDGEVPPELWSYLPMVPSLFIEELELYTLPKGGSFDAVVNVVGTIGKRVKKNFNGYKVFGGASAQ